MQFKPSRTLIAGIAFAPLLALPGIAAAVTVANPLCPDNTALFNPDNGKDVVIPEGFTIKPLTPQGKTTAPASSR